MTNQPIIASDLEGTLSAGSTWKGMRDYLLQSPHAERFKRYYRQNFFTLLRYRFGLLRDVSAFKERWILELLALFEGYSEAEFAEMGQWVIENELWPRRRQAVVAELHQAMADGARVVVISGLFQPLLNSFVAKLACEGVGTPIVFEDGVFTGRIEDQLNTGERKLTLLQPMLDHATLVAAYGDTKRDIPMLSLAQNPVAVHPDDILRQKAVSEGWRIIE